MSFWVKQEEDIMIPDWLNNSLSSKCSICGSPMENYYNDDNRCTNRRCTNEVCPGFIAARADFVRNMLGIKGIGYAKCLSDVRLIKATSVFQLFKIWNITPTVTVDTFLRMHCFPGVDSEWENVVKKLSIYTLDELYERYDGKWKSLLVENKELIYNNLQYVHLKEKPSDILVDKPSLCYTIMITGTPIGYQNKDHFINTINQACKGRIVIIHQKTKKQSGVDFLIRENGSTTRGKVEAAKKGNIPIVTSEVFLAFLLAKMEELNNVN